MIMKSGPFISLVARAYRVEESSVVLYARFLKEAGLMTSGVKGRGAPHMTPMDASRLTIALLATDSPARAVQGLQLIGQLPFLRGYSTFADDPYWSSLPSDFLEGKGLVLEEALARLFAYEPGPAGLINYLPAVEVQENQQTASILWRGGKAVFWNEITSSEEGRQRRAESGSGLRRTRAVFPLELGKVWLTLWLERLKVSDQKVHPLHGLYPLKLDLADEERGAWISRAVEYLEEMDPSWKWGPT